MCRAFIEMLMHSYFIFHGLNDIEKPLNSNYDEQATSRLVRYHNLQAARSLSVLDVGVFTLSSCRSLQLVSHEVDHGGF